MTSPLNIESLMASAVRNVNAAYTAIPEASRPGLPPRDALEQEIDAACAAGDRGRALAAIRAWEGHWVSAFNRAGRG